MPLYEYKCCNVECRETHEILVNGSKRVPKQKRCPVCNCKAEKVQHPGGAFALKGRWPGKGGY